AGVALLDRHQVHRGHLAAAVHLELEFEPVALVERDHPGALDRRDMDEGIRLPIVAGDEAEALGRVEELDGAACLLASQLTLWPALARPAILDRQRLALDPEVRGRHAAAAIHQRELERLALGESGKARLLDRRDV